MTQPLRLYFDGLTKLREKCVVGFDYGEFYLFLYFLVRDVFLHSMATSLIRLLLRQRLGATGHSREVTVSSVYDSGRNRKSSLERNCSIQKFGYHFIPS